MINAYYHVYLSDDVGTWLGIVTEQLKCMEDAKLIEVIDNFKITCIARTDNEAYLFNGLIDTYGFRKVEIDWVVNPYLDDIKMLQNLESDKTVTENYTMRKIYNDCKNNPDMKVLYFHTKGITAVLRHFVNGHMMNYRRYLGWRHFLNWGVLEKWKVCQRAVEKYDVAGVNYQTVPAPHFSGSFWWAKGQHITQLPDPATTEWWKELKAKTTDGWLKGASDRFRDEQWICSKPNTSVFEVCKLTENPAFKYIPRSTYGAT